MTTKPNTVVQGGGVCCRHVEVKSSLQCATEIINLIVIVIVIEIIPSP